MRKFFAYPLSVIFYLAFGLTIVIFHPVQWVCYNWFGYQAHKKSVDYLNFTIMRCLNLLGTRFTFNNPYKIERDQPIIIVANHQGQWDSKIITYEYHGRRGPRQQAVTQVSTYRKGQLHGKFTKRYPDDHIKEQGTYRDGLPYGKITRYERVPSADGQGGETYVKQVYSWKDEQQHGPFAEYYANGKPRRKGKYKAGQLHGKLTTWDQEGEKTVQHYRDGQPVEKQKLTERIKSKLKRKEKPEGGDEVTDNLSD